ncbi:bone morphogenetic protein 1-like [Hydractinia symbiolongicarpus]|uniref:bone morphogenetic protein 1-like n=1 Tax=Hydractinia symbiolongicarpus TaxID=13093 RepID=UPI00254D9090|nr:bone morphogenetic protein 1-like [Hydractinia symbiolongicarpus]
MIGRYLALFLVIALVPTSEGKPTFQAKYGGYVFEGDMILPMSKINIALDGGDVAPKVKERKRIPGQPFAEKVTAKSQYRWPGGVVPYVISKGLKCSKHFWGCFFSGAEKAIKKAMQEWEKNTCIRFVPRTDQRDYIRFIDDGFGKCYSHVGRTGGSQPLSLGKFCRKTGIVIHEIGHALGFYHEQSRPDRDDYVTIKYGNIQSGAAVNFRKYKRSEVQDLALPYDYNSIMHYDKSAFSKWPWQHTIEPKKKGVQIGQRDKLSDGDIKEMKKYYNCN